MGNEVEDVIDKFKMDVLKRLRWRDLEVWQLSHKMVFSLYHLVAHFPNEEKYSLYDQIERSAVSVPANIVEEHARNSTKEFIRFCHISRGSLEELRYYLLLARDLAYITETLYRDYEKRLTKISVKLNNFIHSLNEYFFPKLSSRVGQAPKLYQQPYPDFILS
ncbi:MAG: four helix bundle protein [Candidatus Marinimicrobia bacterium]|nr:four helix bundle protein [Candidatus Neomarinimicrobiota bacterium]